MTSAPAAVLAALACLCLGALAAPLAGHSPGAARPLAALAFAHTTARVLRGGAPAAEILPSGRQSDVQAALDNAKGEVSNAADTVAKAVGVSREVVIGISIGVAALILFAVIACCCCCCRRRRRK